MPYVIEHEILTINDIDLEESDIEDLVELFDENDVFKYIDNDDDEDDNDGGDSDYDDEDEY